MNARIRWWLASAALVLGVAAQAQDDFRGGRIVVNEKLRAVVTVNQRSYQLSGRASGHIGFTFEDLAKGQLPVGAMNVVFFGVDQEGFTRQPPKGDKDGLLAFSLDTSQPQTLGFNPGLRAIFGDLRGRVELSQFSEFLTTPPRGEPDDHDFTVETQPATLRFVMVLDDVNLTEQGLRGVEQRGGRLALVLTADSAVVHQVEMPRYVIAKEFLPFRYDITWIPLEVGRRLCLQPVRVLERIELQGTCPFCSFVVEFSGDGLAFGQPGVKKQWDKADVTFEYRDWISVWNGAYADLTTGEADALRAEVDVDDCVEVFFVESISPQGTWGGGATWGSGLASAKVISSDENANVQPVNETHLAHELGHVVTLAHPGSGYPTAGAPYRADGNTGTLMCPSGFFADNPRVNSDENKTNANNPLMTFAFKVRTAPPDCADDADCGPCYTISP
ncbi:MAG: hypothetical protein H6983_12080 [Ectothiorhodospiraceae bacterium]|nr:hypothetical protein [Chromatiales bacterium]MCP5154898.1 hypothetical protein [Ectothiorhodospiraceae bacterium]